MLLLMGIGTVSWLELKKFGQLSPSFGHMSQKRDICLENWIDQLPFVNRISYMEKVGQTGTAL